MVAGLACHWISNEAPAVFPDILARLPHPPEPGDARFILALDGTPRARTGPHGQSLNWLR